MRTDNPSLVQLGYLLKPQNQETFGRDQVEEKEKQDDDMFSI